MISCPMVIARSGELGCFANELIGRFGAVRANFVSGVRESRILPACRRHRYLASRRKTPPRSGGISRSSTALRLSRFNGINQALLNEGKHFINVGLRGNQGRRHSEPTGIDAEDDSVLESRFLQCNSK